MQEEQKIAGPLHAKSTVQNPPTPLVQPPRDSKIVNIHCVTLNCGGQTPPALEALFPIFEVKNKESQQKGFLPDIYVVGL